MFWPNSCLTLILAPSQRFIKSTRQQAAFDVLITCLFLHALLHVDSLGKYFAASVCGGYWLTERRELKVNTSFVLWSMRGDSSDRFKDAGSSWESQRALSSHCHGHLTCPLLHLHPPRPCRTTSLHTFLPCWPSTSADATTWNSFYLPWCCFIINWALRGLNEDLDLKHFLSTGFYLFFVKCRSWINVFSSNVNGFWHYICFS